MTRRLTGLACCLALALSVAGPAFADNLTDETKKLLELMKLPETIMNGLDQELAIPQEWIDKAKLEPEPLRIRWNNQDSDFEESWKLFHARYPFIEKEFLYTTGADASTQPRLAFAAGTIVVDVANTMGREHALWIDVDGFENITDLPATKFVVDGAVSEDGRGVGYSTNSYCIGYNTEKLKKEDLPKTWDELVATDKFGKGKIGLSVNMTVWLPYISFDKGKDWAVGYMDKLFALEPQRRREGFQMMAKLTGLGEFDIAIPQADKQVAAMQEEGAKIAWHCPEPVPLSFTEIAIIKGNPSPYKSKIFVNWALSREAQLAEFNVSRARPSNAALFEDFTVFPEETKGKARITQNLKIVNFTTELLEEWGNRYGK